MNPIAPSLTPAGRSEPSALRAPPTEVRETDDLDIATAVLGRCESAVGTVGHAYCGIGTGRSLRWIMPHDRTRALAVFDQWRPYSFRSRAGWRLLRAAILLGGPVAFRALRTVREGQGSKPGYAGPLPVIYLGTPGPRRKAVCHMVDAAGRIDCVIKLPIGPEAENALVHEAKMLTELSGLVPSVQIPSLVFNHPFPGAYAQAWVAGTPASLEFAAAHAAYLGSMRRDERLTLREFAAREIGPAGGARSGSVLDAIGALADDASFPAYYLHGDFAPWNLKYRQGQLVALDWEEGRMAGPPLWDLAHYFCVIAFLFRYRASPYEAMLKNSAARHYIKDAGLTSAEVRTLFRYYCLTHALELEARGDSARSRFLAELGRDIEGRP